MQKPYYIDRPIPLHIQESNVYRYWEPGGEIPETCCMAMELTKQDNPDRVNPEDNIFQSFDNLYARYMSLPKEELYRRYIMYMEDLYHSHIRF